MSNANVPLVEIRRGRDGAIALSLNPQGLGVLSSMLEQSSKSDNAFSLELRAAPDFNYRWPETVEKQRNVKDGTVTTPYGTKRVVLGSVKRHIAGLNRSRINVFIDQRPIVQFVASNDGQ